MSVGSASYIGLHGSGSVIDLRIVKQVAMSHSSPCSPQFFPLDAALYLPCLLLLSKMARPPY